MSQRPYSMDDCAITLPSGFRDRTSHVLEWKTEEGDAIALVIQREPLPEGRLDAYVAATIKGYPARFAGMRVERDDEATGDLGGVEIRRMAFRWKHETEVIYHHQAFVLAAGNVVVFTVAGKARHRDRIDQILDQALETLRFREG